LRLEDFESAAEAAARGAGLIAEAARAAVAERGAFALAISGGRTPLPMFERLGEEEVPWLKTRIFQVDERVAPNGDDDRNLTHIEQTLPAAALERLHPMPVTDEDLEAAAGRYERSLPREIDLVHLGIGPDGHTASLVPGDPVLEVTDRRVALTDGEYEGRRRMTLTYPALAAARRVFWLVAGEKTGHALSRLLAGDPSIPAGRVQARDPLVIADRAAAG
jgi:6-phosphogluconolactonase